MSCNILFSVILSTFQTGNNIKTICHIGDASLRPNIEERAALMLGEDLKRDGSTKVNGKVNMQINFHIF